MAFIFKVPRAPDLNMDAKLAEAKAAAEASQYELAIEGDAQQGKLQGVIHGTYRVSDKAVVVSITKKPKMASEAKIRKTVAEFFS